MYDDTDALGETRTVENEPQGTTTEAPQVTRQVPRVQPTTFPVQPEQPKPAQKAPVTDPLTRITNLENEVADLKRRLAKRIAFL